MKLPRLLILISLIFFQIIPSSIAQINGWDIMKEIIKISANASKLSDNCFQLTDDRPWAGGSIYYPNKIDLNKNFKVEMDVFLGCKDEEGADGIVFIFSPKMALGKEGGGIGYEAVSPSIGIEIDTWQNEENNDPYADHIAILQNGVVNHRYGLTKAISFKRNIEDCKEHKVIISWDALEKRLEVSFDGRYIVGVKKDIVQEIFQGDGEVFWGVTASTGGQFNQQKVCFDKINFNPGSALLTSTFKKIELDLLDNKTVALGQVEFKDRTPVLEEVSTRELDELAALLEEQPDMHLGIMGHIETDGSVGKRLSEKRAKAIADYLIKKGIDKKRLNATGFGNRYTGVGAYPGNERIEIYLYRPLP